MGELDRPAGRRRRREVVLMARRNGSRGGWPRGGPVVGQVGPPPRPGGPGWDLPAVTEHEC